MNVCVCVCVCVRGTRDVFDLSCHDTYVCALVRESVCVAAFANHAFLSPLCVAP